MDLNILNWDWDQEFYPSSSDLWVLIFFAPFFLFLRLILDRSILERSARRVVFPRGKCVDSKDRRKRIVKFKESAWKCLCAISTEALAFYIIYKEPWFKDTKCFWLGPGDQMWPDQKIKLKMKGLYTFVGGLNVYSLFALFFWETRRSDFKVMIVHHIVTIFLIILSYVFRFCNIGSSRDHRRVCRDSQDVQIQRPRNHGYCLVHPMFPDVDGSATHLLPFMDPLGYQL
ncbi:hypothetical protein N665_0072s0039 [Sinapis alba]|nr:hypothetical protein N665_0072s0039 [Sinapis alba]